MGLFNAFNSIGEINNLLSKVEYQMDTIAKHMDSGNYPSRMVMDEMAQVENLFDRIVNIASNSSGARVASYKFKGYSMKLPQIIDLVFTALSAFERKL